MSEAMEKGNKMFNQMCSALKKLGLKFEADETKLKIHFIMNGDDLPMDCYMRVDADRQLIIFQSPLSFKFSEDRRVDAAVAICSINYLLRYGGFDLDIRNGYTLFRLVCSYRDSVVGDELFKLILGTAVGTTDNYNDKLFALEKGKMKATDFLPDN